MKILEDLYRNYLILSHLLERVLLPEALRAAEKDGLSKAQYEMLLFIETHPGIRPAELARGLGVSAPTVTTALQRLAKRGLVHKSPVPSDLRGVTLRLTAAGERLLTAVEHEHTQIFAKLIAGVPPQQLCQLAEGLDALLMAAAKIRDHSQLCLQCGNAHSPKCVLCR